ncbi:MAG: hypothetical protein GXO68_03725 [Crenarchaeota archaeon]|nr:hypothetical protein [Thermoproteota archaeon]
MQFLEFLWWNAVVGVLLYIILRTKDFTALAVSYLITLWTLLKWVITQPVTIEGRLANITEYVDAANNTIREYAYQTYTVPQNWLDFTYTVFLAVLSLYVANKIVLTDVGRQIRRTIRGWMR